MHPVESKGTVFIAVGLVAVFIIAGLAIISELEGIALWIRFLFSTP